MTIDEFKPNKILRGPIFPEPIQVMIPLPLGDAVKVDAKSLSTSRVYESILTDDQRAALVENIANLRKQSKNAARLELKFRPTFGVDKSLHYENLSGVKTNA
jgi:hypothetical protein